jgi:hypothetical protein
MKKLLVILALIAVSVGAQPMEDGLASINQHRLYYGLEPVQPAYVLFEAAYLQVFAMRQLELYDHNALPVERTAFVFDDRRIWQPWELINKVPALWIEARQPSNPWELLTESYTYSEIHYGKLMDPEVRFVGFYTEEEPINGYIYSCIFTAEERRARKDKLP